MPGADAIASGVAVAEAAAPSVGDVLSFARYVADLIGADRVEHVSVKAGDVHVEVSDTIAADAAVHLLGLDAEGWGRPRFDWAPTGADDKGRTSWHGRSGRIEVTVTGPLALGGLPERRPHDWSTSGRTAVSA